MVPDTVTKRCSITLAVHYTLAHGVFQVSWRGDTPQSPVGRGFETRILSKYTQEKEEGLTYRQLLTYNVDQENIELRNRHLQEDRGMTQATARRLVGGEGGVFKFSQPIF